MQHEHGAIHEGFLAGHKKSVRCIATLPEPNLVASGSEDESVRVWSVSTRSCVRVLKGHSAWVQALCVLPLNGRLASAAGDVVNVWNVEAGVCESTIRPKRNTVYSLATMNQGRIAVGTFDDALKVYDVEHNVEVFDAGSVHQNAVHALAVTSDQCVISGSHDRSIRVFDLRCANINHTKSTTTSAERRVGCVHTVTNAHAGWITCLLMLPDGRLASAGDDNVVRVWDIRADNKLTPFLQLDWHTNNILSLATLTI